MEWVQGGKGRLARVSLTSGSPDCKTWSRKQRGDAVEGVGSCLCSSSTSRPHLPRLFPHCWLCFLNVPSSLQPSSVGSSSNTNWNSIVLVPAWLTPSPPLYACWDFTFPAWPPLEFSIYVFFFPNAPRGARILVCFLPLHWCIPSAQRVHES